MKNYIPTINISSLIKNNFNTTRSQQTIKKIEKACIEVGFFQVVGHGINIKKINDVCKITFVNVRIMIAQRAHSQNNQQLSTTRIKCISNHGARTFPK